MPTRVRVALILLVLVACALLLATAVPLIGLAGVWGGAALPTGVGMVTPVIAFAAILLLTTAALALRWRITYPLALGLCVVGTLNGIGGLLAGPEDALVYALWFVLGFGSAAALVLLLSEWRYFLNRP